MPEKRLKTIVFISIGVFFLLLWFLLTRGQTTIALNPKEPHAPQEQHRVVRSKSTQTRKLETSRKFQESEFYRTIIDNNLFRPLGWRPARPREPYCLIGTILPTDGDPKAILQTTAGNRTYTLTIGDTLDAETTITDIQPKQVTLEKAGQQRTLRLNTTPWLK